MAEKKILVVDRDVVTRKFLKHTLETKGYLVSQAESGKEGLVLAWRDQPDIIVVDPNFSDLDSEIFIQKLKLDARSASMPVIALSSHKEADFGNACLEQGYTLYLPKSGNAISELLKIIQGFSSAKVTKIAKKADQGKVLVFLSAKGGTGTSSLCANIAMNIHNTVPEAKVVVVDMVLPIGSIAPLVGYKESINITTISDLPQAEITSELLLKSLPHINLWKFHLLAGAPNPEAANTLQIKKIPHILEILKDNYDYVFIDLGRSLSRISLPIIQQASLIVLILGNDKGTVQLTKTVSSYLERLGVNLNKIYPVLNRAIGLEGLTKADAEKMLGLEIKMTVPYMGGNFTIANNQMQPVTHKFPNDTGAFMLRSITEDLLTEARKHKK